MELSTMTVGDLISTLRQYDPNLRVVLSGDGEGNEFRPLAEHGSGHYEPDNSWRGGFELTNEAGEVNAVALFPVN